MVSTQDSESCDPSSNLGGTYNFYNFFEPLNFAYIGSTLMNLTARAVSGVGHGGLLTKNLGSSGI